MHLMNKFNSESNKFLLFFIFLLTFSMPQFSEKIFAAGENLYQKTLWSDKSELYMEYDPPEVGKLGGFLIYLTDLTTFKSLSEVKVEIAITDKNGKTVLQRIPYTGRPGIFAGSIAPKESGKHTFTLEVSGDNFKDKISYNSFIVREKGKRFSEEGHFGNENADVKISFSKVQQWTVDFKVTLPETRNMPTILSVSGELVANPASEAVVSVPVTGMVAFDKPLVHQGQRVLKGDELCHIEPPISPDSGADKLRAQVAEARNRVLLAKKEHDRAKHLFEGKAGSRKRLEEAEIMLKIARSNLAPLEKAFNRILAGSSCGHTIIKAPIGGTVIRVETLNGSYMKAGEPLLKIVDTSSLWLKANVPVAEIGHSEHLSSAYFTIAGSSKLYRPSRLINVSDIVDPVSRTVETIFEVENPESRLKIGMFASVFMQNGLEEKNLALAIPAESVFEDEGKYFVYIQNGGEVFIRREVTIGNSAFGLVAVKSGIGANDRVVAKGGYYVKQASMSSKTPEGHGHEH